MDKIYFYLPGLAEFFDVHVVLYNRMKAFPDHYYDNIEIGGIFGCVPGALWNGGRISQGIVDGKGLETMLKWHWDTKIPIRWTWTNQILEPKDLKDPYCNWATLAGHNGLNEVLVNNDMMENFIRENYPLYPLISSTTKRLNNIDDLNNELKKDYKLVVIDYDFNNDWDMLKKIKHPEKCEILINAVCNPKCPIRKRHYELISKLQKGMDEQVYEELKKDFPQEHMCTAQTRLPYQVKQLPTFISREDLYGKYYDAGFRHFKIEGRGMCPTTPIEWYLYYMVKPEWQDVERDHLHEAMESVLANPTVPIYAMNPTEENS